MRIVAARVTNYRSVIDSTSFEVESDKTILVGVNEAGKTALLKALQHIKAPPGTPPLDELADYPRSKLNDLQVGKVGKSTVPVATVTYSLDAEDLAALPSSLQIAADARISFIKRLDNKRYYRLDSGFPGVPTFGDFKESLARLKAHVAKAAESEGTVRAIDALTANLDQETIDGVDAEAWRETLTAVMPFVDEDNEKELARWRKLNDVGKQSELLTQAIETLAGRIPLMVYYSTYFTVRPRIDLASLAARQERGDIDGEYDFGNLCLLKLLGFTARQLSDMALNPPEKPYNYENDPNLREQHETALAAHQRKLDDRSYRLNSASVKLTTDIRRVWGDDGMRLRIVADGQYLKVMVEDALGVEIELDQRSEGFRWLVSFFVVFRSQAQDDLKGAVLLLDEPGMSLHALKQQEFRKTVSLLGVDNQIIYSTHSPFMVGSDELDLVRIVEMADRELGTKVHTRLQVDDPKSIFPLQAALGYELAQSMFSQKRNLVCEGVTDMFYLNAMNAAAAADSGPTFKNDPAVVPAGTASKVAYFCVIYASQKLAVAALLDSDNEGDKAASQDSLVALLPQKAILRAADFVAPSYKGAEIEDLFRTTLTGIAKSLGWDSEAKIATQTGRPIMDILVDDYGKSIISKWKLSKGFARWLQDNSYSDLPEAERAAWTKLVAAVNKAL